MSAIAWEDKYSVEIEAIDKQHQSLFDMFNELYEAYQSDTTDKKILKDILHKLINYMYEHFETEEELLKEYDYPATKHHIEKHNHFKDEINEKYKIFISKSDSENLPEELILFMINWISEHILKTDKEYLTYFKKNEFLNIINKKTGNK